MFPRLTTYFVFFKLVTLITAAPAKATSVNPATETLDCNDKSEETEELKEVFLKNETSDIYDQRQNGTENYRIHVNGVVVLVAPAETVLQAAQLGSLQMGMESEMNVSTSLTPKPKPKPSATTDKVPNDSHAANIPTVHPKDAKDKNNLKLLNLLQMFRSIRHNSEETAHHLNK